MKTIKTLWEVRTYDVWGNDDEGYWVNDSFVIASDYPINLKIQIANPGQPSEFLFAFPSDYQIRQALGINNCNLSIDGDDLTIYVNRAKDYYPLGELHCTSHNSLSPIRE